jgi:hypothetical protein
LLWQGMEAAIYDVLESIVAMEMVMAAALKRLNDEREVGESIMERALREDGRLPASIATEICADPMAELTRLRNRGNAR